MLARASVDVEALWKDGDADYDDDSVDSDIKAPTKYAGAYSAWSECLNWTLQSDAFRDGHLREDQVAESLLPAAGSRSRVERAAAGEAHQSGREQREAGVGRFRRGHAVLVLRRGQYPHQRAGQVRAQSDDQHQVR